jgi:hypothetical protein
MGFAQRAGADGFAGIEKRAEEKPDGFASG